jgi:hypothetical protein
MGAKTSDFPKDRALQSVRQNESETRKRNKKRVELTPIGKCYFVKNWGNCKRGIIDILGRLITHVTQATILGYNLLRRGAEKMVILSKSCVFCRMRRRMIEIFSLRLAQHERF